MSNVTICKNGSKNGRFCSCAKIGLNSKKQPILIGCSINQNDFYNIYPEHDENGGDYIFNNQQSTDPFPFGINLLWENDTNRNNGLTYEGRGLRCENIHPLYHVKDINIPVVTRGIGDDEVGEIVGKENCALMINRWNEQRIYGIPRVERCDTKIYGTFNRKKPLNRIIPKCLKDFTNEVPNWNNYTTKKYIKFNKELYLSTASNEEIDMFCLKNLGNNSKGKNISEILKFIKTGEFINIYEAMLNNNISEILTKKIMIKIAFGGINIYPYNFCINSYVKYYTKLDKIFKNHPKLIDFKCNLINYILNYPKLSFIDLNKEEIWVISKGRDKRSRYNTDERYWDIVNLLKFAYKDKILKNLSNWMENMIKTNKYKIKKFNTLNGEFSLSDLDNESQRDIAESFQLGLEDPIDLYPAMRKISNIIDVKSEHLKTFSRILNIGRYWNAGEIRIVYDRFKKAYDQKEPILFWNFIESIILTDQHIANQLINKYGPSFSQGRRFATNLLEAKIDNDSFDLLDIDESRWEFTKSKGTNRNYKYEQRYYAPWILLSKLGGLKFDGKEDLYHLATMDIEQCIDEDNSNDNIDLSYEDDFITDLDFLTVKNIDIDDKEDDEYEYNNSDSFLELEDE